MIYAPFIPLWYIGEEWNNPLNLFIEDAVLYYNRIDWQALLIPQNRAFYEDVKAMLRIRRQYPEIFAYYPEQFIHTNICKVEAIGGGLQAYARYAGDTAILIVPNYNASGNGNITLVVPFAACGLEDKKHFIATDAVSGEVIAEGNADEVRQITLCVPFMDQRVLVIKSK